MEGLKLIAQSTFDRHQKFRSGSDDSQRYNVIEIGAFEAPNTPSLTSGTASNRQSIVSQPNTHSVSDGSTSASKSQDGAPKATGSVASDAGGNRTTFNEWTVHEEDLVAFMKMKPVESFALSPKKSMSQLQQTDAKLPKAQGQATDSGTASTAGHSRSVSLQSNKTASTTATTATTATTGTSPVKASDEAPRRAKQEVEAAASLKIVCIQRAAPDESSGADTNTLAISREAFLHLYVDTMDADHGALYFIARDYDGFHEYNDTTKGVVTTFIGTADYALVWTFNRRSLETRGLLIDRKPPEKAKDPDPAPETSSKRKQSKAAPVVPSDAWVGFRNMLKMYRGYIFAPPLLSFVSCLHMLHSFDDQLSASDLPHVKDIEKKVGSGATENTRGGELARTSQSKSQSLSRQSSSYATRLSTEPSYLDFSPGTPTQQKPFSIDRLITWSQASGEIADSAARKLRQIKMGREILEMLSREHETVVADVVAPPFLDRYHRAMQGMIEAIPAVERHMASLEETLVDLKARTERLNGLVCALHCLSAYHPLQGGLKLTASAY